MFHFFGFTNLFVEKSRLQELPLRNRNCLALNRDEFHRSLMMAVWNDDGVAVAVVVVDAALNNNSRHFCCFDYIGADTAAVGSGSILRPWWSCLFVVAVL